MSVVAQDRYVENKEWFIQLFQAVEAQLNGLKKRPLFAIQKDAIGDFGQFRFPTRRDEDWKYTSLAPLLKPQYQEAASMELTNEQLKALHIDGLDAHVLIFVNGHFNKSLSSIGSLPEGVALIPVSEALENNSYGSKVKSCIQEWKTDPGRAFVTLNTAFAKEGWFIHVPKNAILDKPIHFLYVNTPTESAAFANPQHIVIAEQSSELTFIESYHTLGNVNEPFFTNGTNRVVVKENAKVEHYRIQNESEKHFLINNTEAYQDRDSTYSNYTIDLGGKIVRNNLSAIINDQSTLSNFYGIYVANQNQHIDNQSFIDHAFAHGLSNELYKGIITDKATGVFNGKVIVRQDAQKINAFQQNSSLVLSDTAKMDSKPQLEIYADDVRCSHGATIGQLSNDEIYYLRTRGLNQQQARSILQFAFLGEVLDRIKLDAIKADLVKKVQIKLESVF